MPLAKAIGRARMRGGKAGKTLGEDSAWALDCWTREAPDRDLEPNGSPKAGQIDEPASIPAVDPRGVGAADRANGTRRGGCQHDGQRIVIKNAMIESAPSGSSN